MPLTMTKGHHRKCYPIHEHVGRVLARLFPSGCSPIFLLPVRRVFIRQCFYIGNENISRWIRVKSAPMQEASAFRDFDRLIKINPRHWPDGRGSFSLPPEDLTRF